MVLAAIDIGSNGIRFQVIRILKNNERIGFKKLEYIRFPLRLGRSVFAHGEIDKVSETKFIKLMECFRLLMNLYQVDDYIAAATSAMREAANGQKIIKKVSKLYQIDIQLISGKEEARLLGKAIMPFLNEDSFVQIDVGGGSTEVNVFFEKKMVDSMSLKIGSVRGMDGFFETEKGKNLHKSMRMLRKNLSLPITAVGTGGNIHKLFKLSNRVTNNFINLTEIKAMKAYISQYSYEERINLLNLNPDRADVIEQASDIYIDIMEKFGANKMLVPGVGLKDGLLYKLYEEKIEIPLVNVQFSNAF